MMRTLLEYASGASGEGLCLRRWVHYCTEALQRLRNRCVHVHSPAIVVVLGLHVEVVGQQLLPAYWVTELLR